MDQEAGKWRGEKMHGTHLRLVEAAVQSLSPPIVVKGFEGLLAT